MSGPDVSALIAAYNASAFVGRAIESVLSQTHRGVECVVVDDGSSDDTAAIARSYGDRVTLIRQRNSGVSAARNAAARAATGRFVAFLDADDAWLPTKTERQLERAATGDFGLIYSGYYVTDGDLRPLYEIGVPDDGVALLNSVLLTPPGINVAHTGLVPKEVFFEVGGFDERLSVSADLDLGLQIALRHPIAAVPEPLALYRRHGVQMSDDYARMESDAVLLLDKFYSHPGLSQALKRHRSASLANLYLILAGGYATTGRRARAVGCLLKAARHHPVAAAATFARRLAWTPAKKRDVRDGSHSRVGDDARDSRTLDL